MRPAATIELGLPKPTPPGGDAAEVAGCLRTTVLAVARGELPSRRLPVRWLAQPRTILGALETLSWSRRIGVPATSEADEGLEALLAIDRSRVLADPRVCRLWALALTAADTEASDRWRGKAESIAEELAPVEAETVTGQTGLDRALAALVLHAAVGEPRWPAEALPVLLDATAEECDAIGLAYMLAHGAVILPTAPEVRRSSWLDLFGSMTPRSLPYGWLSATAALRGDSADHEIASLSGLLGLHLAGLANIHPD